MKQNEKLEIENSRIKDNPESLWTINLFREGAFYRMYQRSAWIMVQYSERALTPIVQDNSADKKVVFVGFPVESIDGWIPKGFSLIQKNEEEISLLPGEEILHSCQSMEESVTDFLKWFDEQKPKEKKSKDKRGTSQGIAVSDMDYQDIWIKVLAFPLEQKNLMECLMFIRELKEDIAQKLIEPLNNKCEKGN